MLIGSYVEECLYNPKVLQEIGILPTLVENTAGELRVDQEAQDDDYSNEMLRRHVTLVTNAYAEFSEITNFFQCRPWRDVDCAQILRLYLINRIRRRKRIYLADHGAPAFILAILKSLQDTTI